MTIITAPTRSQSLTQQHDGLMIGCIPDPGVTHAVSMVTVGLELHEDRAL